MLSSQTSELSKQESVKSPFDKGVCLIWALRVEQESVKLLFDGGGRSVNICEITIGGLGGWSANTWSNKYELSEQSRNLWNCHLMGVGRSAKTWSAKCWALRVGMKYEFHRNLWNCHLMWGVRSAKTWSVKCWPLRAGSCQSRNLWNCHLMGGVDLSGPGLPND